MAGAIPLPPAVTPDHPAAAEGQGRLQEADGIRLGEGLRRPGVVDALDDPVFLGKDLPEQGGPLRLGAALAVGSAPLKAVQVADGDAAALPQCLGQGAFPAAAAADDPEPHWQRFRAVRMRSFTSMGAKEARMAQRFMASRSS